MATSHSKSDQALANSLSDVMRAAVRRIWLQGKPVYEDIDGKTYAWWPDGRMTPQSGGGPELFADTQTVFIS